MTSGVRATLLFVGHQLRPIGLPVACTVVFCTVVFCTVVFCTASSACSTSANMPLGCKARHFTSMGKSIRSGNFKLPVVAIIVLPLPLHCTNGGAKAKGCIYVQLTLEKNSLFLTSDNYFLKSTHNTHCTLQQLIVQLEDLCNFHWAFCIDYLYI